MKKNYLDPEFNILSLSTSSEFLSASQPDGAGDEWSEGSDGDDFGNGGNSGDGWG